MDGEDHRQGFADAVEGFQQRLQLGGIIHIGGAVQGRQGEVRRDRMPGSGQGHGSRHRAGQIGPQRIDHHITDEMDLGGVNAFAGQIGGGVPFGGEQDVRYLIGQDAVDFLGHGAVARAQARLHMDHRLAALDRHQGAGQGGIHISHHQGDGVGRGIQHRLEPLHHFGGLDRMAGRAHFQIGVGPGHPQLGEEGAAIDGIYICPHGPDDDCDCRKPLPGMVDQAVADHHFDPARAFMIGDKEVDVELGQAVGAETFLVRTGHGAKFVEGTKADHVVDDLAAAVRIIEKSVTA